MALISSINPTTEEINAQLPELTDSEIEKKINHAYNTFLNWRTTSLVNRIGFLLKLIKVLQKRKEILAQTIVKEMGKTITSARDEIEKCISLAQYYYENAESFLKPENIYTNNTNLCAQIHFDPLGVILNIVSWNFPFWLPLRFIIPTITAGNVVLLKHSSKTPLCGIEIEKVIADAEYPFGVVQNLTINSDKVSTILRDDRIKGVNFVGGVKGGSMVASEASKNIKKIVMELGGNDPFIILKDADLNLAAENLVKGRMRNAGQACNSPKRVIVHDTIYEEFIHLVLQIVKNIKQGDPMNEDVEIGPLANLENLENTLSQLNNSIKLGCNLIYGGKRLDQKGYFLQPAVVTNVTTNMPLFKEEVFGPIISITPFESTEEAIKLANMSEFGLGASIWTKDTNTAKTLILLIEAGNVYINRLVRSENNLPFGGIKKSGIGRELGIFGIREFVNIKSVVGSI